MSKNFNPNRKLKNKRLASARDNLRNNNETDENFLGVRHSMDLNV